MVDPSDWEIRPLTREHDREEFRCGEPELDEFLSKYARQNQEKGIARTYVATKSGSSRVLGYFTLRGGHLERAELPERAQRQLPRYPVPVAHLARLSVDQNAQGMRLGERLLLEALRKAREVSEILGLHGVEVLAKNDRARLFYERYGFRPARGDPHHLYLSMKRIEKLL